MRRPLTSRRGDLRYMLGSTVDIILSLLVILLVILVVVGLARVFFKQDERSRNQYELTADLLRGVIEDPGVDGVALREFSFPFTAKGDQRFTGAIFGVNYDAATKTYQYTTPFPPVNWYTRDVSRTISQSVMDAYVQGFRDKRTLTEKKVVKGCKDRACLCYSPKSVVKADDTENLLAALNGITRCTAYAAPEGKTVRLDFDRLQRIEQARFLGIIPVDDERKVYDATAYPVVELRKGSCEVGASPDTLCVYFSLKPNES